MTSAFASERNSPDSFVLSVSMTGNVDYQVQLRSSKDDRVLSFVSEKCEFNNEAVFLRTGESGALLSDELELSDVKDDRGMWQHIRSFSAIPSYVREALDTLTKYSIYAPQVDFLRGQAPGLTLVTSVGLHGEGLPAAVSSLLKHRLSHTRGTPEEELQRDALNLVFLPGWASEVRVGKVDDRLVSRAVVGKGQAESMLYFEDLYMEKNKKRLSAYDSSEGTLFLLFVAVLLVHIDSPKIFCLDNVDNGLNPAMTRKMIEKIIEITEKSSANGLQCGPRQVFLTSHNPTAIDAFDLFDNDQRIFVISRNAAGHTEVTRLKPPDGTSREDWVATHHGNSLSKLWIEGAIEGALGPDL